MKQIFNLENPVWQFIGRLVDVVVLHVIWLVVSIPIVTLGPATTALYYALMKDVADEGPHYVKNFFKSFKENFKQGAIMGIILVVVGALITFSILYYYRMAASGSKSLLWPIILGMAVVFALLYLFVVTYAYPLLARFENTIINTLKNAFLMSIKHIGWTLLMVVFMVGFYVLTIMFIPRTVPLLVFGYGAVALMNSYVLNHVFKPYLKAAGGGDPDRDPDEWVIPEDELPGDTEEPNGEEPKEEVKEAEEKEE